MHLSLALHAVFVFANSFSFPSEHVLFMYVKEQQTIHTKKKLGPQPALLKQEIARSYCRLSVSE